MKPPPFRYVRPASIEEVLDTLAEHGDDAKVLAGGQSLVPLLNFRLARPAVLVDLGSVAALSHCEVADGWLVVGAMVRQRFAERSEDVRSGWPLIPEALGHVGHLQIRNRGTVGGSIAHADPAAELPAVALALEATIVVRSRSAERTVQAAEFFEGPFMTAVAPDEIVSEVRFPPVGGARQGFIELARRSGDFALAGVAAVNHAANGAADLRLAALGVAGTAVRLPEAEEAARGRDLTDPAVRREAGAAASASAAVAPFTDVHADADYRRELVGTLVRRLLARVA